MSQPPPGFSIFVGTLLALVIVENNWRYLVIVGVLVFFLLHALSKPFDHCTTHPFRDGAPLLLPIETPPTFGRLLHKFCPPYTSNTYLVYIYTWYILYVLLLISFLFPFLWPPSSRVPRVCIPSSSVTVQKSWHIYIFIFWGGFRSA